MKIKLMIAALLSPLLACSASAALNIELTQGVRSAVPMVVLPFSGQALPKGSSLAAVITQDLQNSGQFNVKPLMPAQPAALAADLDLAWWRKHKIDNVLLGSVTALAAGKYRVSYQLVSVFARPDPRQSEDARILLSASLTTDAAGLRGASHRIADAIYQKITGVAGVFHTRIAYVLVKGAASEHAQYRLMVADYDGFNPKTLLVSAEPIMSPSWSADAASLAYVSFEGGHAAIYRQDLATAEREVLSDYPGINGAPAFSPDGRKLALVLTRSGHPKIYVMDLASHKLTAVTQGYAIDTEPAWAGDGQSLVFTSNRGGSPQVYRYHLASKAVERLSFDGNYNAHASLSKGDEQLVMMHRDAGLFGIACQDLSSGRLQTLVQTGFDESPSVAPNGKMVLYATRYGGRGVLAEVSIDGLVKLRLPTADGSVREPAWSPR